MTDIIENDKHELFDRVVAILEQARSNVVRAVNSNMVIAYWLIGREIVEEIQGGENRADYGKQIIEELSKRLNKKYGKGFSITTLKYFRTFYQVYSERFAEIGRPMGDQFKDASKGRPLGDLLSKTGLIEEKQNINFPKLPDNMHEPKEIYNDKPLTIQYPMGTISLPGFSPQLSWSHYRALMRVKKDEARLFYEKEAIECCWDKRTLERHIQSQYYERLLKSQQPETMQKSARLEIQKHNPSEEILKNPYVLEFLGLPDSSTLHESELESAIITNLQTFLLELGKGFAFVGRQKRLRFDDKDLYVDLVFYNCILKCYLLIDLKMGELSYQDVGQMDGYVRMFDDLYTAEDDNPTVGLILCTEKNEAVAKYSVLSERKQIFSSQYMLYLPSEEELKELLQRERKLIEIAMKNKTNH
jgi:predicted nuclease of restriction endonuclease-like (RecB) superfamily